MANQDRFAINRMLFAGTAFGVKRASAPPPSNGDLKQGNGWARQVPGNGSEGKRRLFAAADRRWVHLIYVLIDIVLISFGALAAFLVRFVPLGTWHVLHAGGWGANFELKSYSGFLLLYAILIVLLCQTQ